MNGGKIALLVAGGMLTLLFAWGAYSYGPDFKRYRKMQRM